MPPPWHREDSDDESRKPNANTSIDYSNRMFSLLGSTTILQLFGPEVMGVLRRWPMLGSAVRAGLVGSGIFLSAKSLLNNSFLPVAYFRFDDKLYEDLCRFVLDHKSKGFSASWPPGDNSNLVQSTNYRRNAITQEVWWPKGHQGEKNIYYEKYGLRFFYHNGTLFVLDIHPRHRRSSMPKQGQAGLRALAINDKPIKALLNDVWKMRHHDDGSRRTTIYTAVSQFGHGWWERAASKPVRRLSTVNIDEEYRIRLLKDAGNYLKDETKVWYARRGIPYRRGYLFHGAPGTGKSSLSVALAGHFELDVYSIQLSSSRLTDDRLMELVRQLPERCVLLLEDIDSAGLTREKAKKEDGDDDDDDGPGPPPRPKGVTLSGLLNALDGAAAPEGHILIMSSNNPENLDPALVRAGRIDRKFQFKLVDKAMAREIFARMMQEDRRRSQLSLEIDTALLVKAEEFASHIPEGIFAPATIQGYLLEHMGQLDTTLDNVEKWVKEQLAEQAAKKAEKEKEDEERAKQMAEAKKEAAEAKKVEDGEIKDGEDQQQVLQQIQQQIQQLQEAQGNAEKKEAAEEKEVVVAVEAEAEKVAEPVTKKRKLQSQPNTGQKRKTRKS